MAGLCEGGNEPPGSLKASNAPRLCTTERSPTGGAGKAVMLIRRFVRGAVVETRSTIRSTRKEKNLFGSLAEKKLPTEECTGMNGEREKSSGQKKISDDRRR
ncbi:hypothetical protein ANN_23926 [Periplaneta americana]|uniref:Uncharacterized protein n=1 Tax=Periplaneta americana TaxID=6978 RepID=A0ABQ8S1N9_PERAM|nr:hypothetical protein ANN_23926 [Periplaneta americana]